MSPKSTPNQPNLGLDDENSPLATSYMYGQLPDVMNVFTERSDFIARGYTAVLPSVL